MKTEEGFSILLALSDAEETPGIAISITGYIEIVIFLKEEAFHEAVIAEHESFILNDFPILNQQLKHGICHRYNKREPFDSIEEQFPVHGDK